ncbi:hypothetical protein GTN31_01910 [Macrococcoides canis]|uniref:hypothetical protein n=1 Tax=Macrococcoides canis TaxID=1855823 RepID=UPI0013E8FDE7|nr:hypothetical protein [Macrococcus canis]QIH75101.1 hypothetical protein GTN31_01910 [Macrococcus canis]
MRHLYDKMNELKMDDVAMETMKSKEVNHYFETFQQKNNTVKKKKKKAPVLAVAVAAAAILTPTLNHDIQANIVRALDNVSYSFKDIITPEAEKYATHINETINLGNTDVKLTDVYVSDKSLVYNLLIDGKGKGLHADLSSVKINGKEAYEGSSGGSGVINKDDIISDNMVVHLRESVPKEKMEVELTFSGVRSMSGKDETETKSFGYKFEVNPNELNNAMFVKDIHHSLNLNGGKININKIKISPIHSNITLDSNLNHRYNINLYDEHGKIYAFDALKTEKDNSKYVSSLFFNQDVGSTGTIDDMNKAQILKLEIIDTGIDKNGAIKEEGKSNKEEVIIKK